MWWTGIYLPSTYFYWMSHMVFFFFNLIYFWLPRVFIAVHRLFQVVASRGSSLVVVLRLLTVVVCGLQ